MYLAVRSPCLGHSSVDSVERKQIEIRVLAQITSVSDDFNTGQQNAAFLGVEIRHDLFGGFDVFAAS